MKLPLEKWLSPKQLAAHFGLKEDSGERWIREGTVPRRLIRFCGRRRMLVHPDAVQLLENIFETAHE